METQVEPAAEVTDTAAIAEIQRRQQQAKRDAPQQPKQVGWQDLADRLPPPDEQRQARLEQLYSRQEAQKKAAEKRAALSSLEMAAGSRYVHCRLNNYRVYDDAQSRVTSALREYLETLSDRIAACEGVILYGPVGTGKDHLAYAICRGAIRSLDSVGWTNGQAWFGKLRDNMDAGKSEAMAISELSRPPLLCISDPLPPVGPLTQHQTTMLYRLIDARYASGRPTIVTVNVQDNADAEDRMGTATWDRLCHGAWKIRCDWPTIRIPSREIP